MGVWDFMDRWLSHKVYFKRYEITLEEDEVEDFKRELKEKRKRGIITVGKIVEVGDEDRKKIGDV